MKIIQKKICLLGAFAVGKTSLVRRFVEGRFDEKYLSTVGVSVSRKSLDRNGHQLNLLLWDMVGGTEMSHRETGYLVGAAGALIVCDLTRSTTLDAMAQYARQMRVLNPRSALVFVGNKADLTADRVITDAQLLDISHSFQSGYYITSAKTGSHVEAAFANLADRLEGRDDNTTT